MKRALWTPAQDVELQTLFATMTSQEVAAKLGRSVSAVEEPDSQVAGSFT